MSKILQVRRGTTDANNKFTGMPGELSFDTDKKTLRVHDGETLGGFELSRTDQISSNGNAAFDITSVSDEFWTETVARFAPPTFTILTSPQIKVKTTVPSTEYIFDAVNKDPVFIRVMMICQSPDAGYAIGDVVYAFGIGNRTNPSPNMWTDDNGVHVCLMVGNEEYWVSHKDTGVRTNITQDNWRLLFRVYC